MQTRTEHRRHVSGPRAARVKGAVLVAGVAALVTGGAAVSCGIPLDAQPRDLPATTTTVAAGR